MPATLPLQPAGANDGRQRRFSADEETGRRSNEPTQRIELTPHALVFSYEHQVRVQP